VLGPRPTSVLHETVVDLPRPRDVALITAPRFAELEAEVLDQVSRGRAAGVDSEH
jgi:putative hydroxymethylpyrimidine transport system ATP-binding protein